MSMARPSRRTILAAAVASTVPMAGCGGGDKNSGGAAARSYSWRLAETHPKDYPTTQADIWFADQLRERSNGRIDVQVFPSAQLGEERAVLEQVQLGAIQMTRVSAGPMSEFVESWGVFNLPYIFSDEKHLWSFLSSGPARRMLEDLEAGKFVGLAYYDAGARNFYTTKTPVRTPDDLKGAKIRVIESSVNADMIEALGGSATPMDYGEVYSSLETGVIDGAENNEPSFVSSGHAEVARYYTRDAHQRVPEVLLVNQQEWSGMPKADRELIREVATESIDEQRKLWDQEVRRSVSTMKREGIEIIDVDVTSFQQAVAPMLDRYRSSFADSMAAIEKAR